MAKTTAQKAAEETLKKAQEAAASRAGKTTAERLAEAKAAREEKLAAQAVARPTGKEIIAAKAEASKLEYGKKIAERAWESATAGTADGNLDPQSLANWELWLYDRETGKKRTTKEIIAAVTDAVLADKSGRWQGVSLDPATGKPRPSSDAEKVRAAMAQLVSDVQREGKYRQDAFEIANELRGDYRRYASEALASRPETWQYSPDSVGKVVTRKNFEDPVPISTLVLDPTKNQLTPEQLKQFPSITSLGGMAIDPVTGFQVLIDTQGRYTLGEQPTGDWLSPGQDYSKYQPSYTPPDYRLYTIGGTDSPDNLGTGGTGGTSGMGGTGSTGGLKSKATITYDANGKPMLTEENPISENTRDAFAALTDLFQSYGLGNLAGEISDYMTEGFTASEALIKLKTNPTGSYAKRFAGNFARAKKGLNVISEAAYLANEKAYAETLKAYGLGNTLSLNSEDNYKKFADYIAGDISPDEFKDRVNTVVTRVQNADASIKSTLKAFYPEITDADLVGYFLNPKENLPKLQEKVTASEIGAAALGAGAGLTTNVTTATDLARYGIDKEEAREGYSTIAGVLPTATKLGDIYNQSGIRYAQAEGEAEVFKGSQDAATKRKRLASMERAAFGGSSGTGQSSLTRSTQGLI